jgi:hypothetical protein
MITSKARDIHYEDECNEAFSRLYFIVKEMTLRPMKPIKRATWGESLHTCVPEPSSNNGENEKKDQALAIKH